MAIINGHWTAECPNVLSDFIYQGPAISQKICSDSREIQDPLTSSAGNVLPASLVKFMFCPIWWNRSCKLSFCLSLSLPFKTINKYKNKRKAHNELFTSKFHLPRPLIIRKRCRNPNKRLYWMGGGNLNQEGHPSFSHAQTPAFPLTLLLLAITLVLFFPLWFVTYGITIFYCADRTAVPGDPVDAQQAAP